MINFEIVGAAPYAQKNDPIEQLFVNEYLQSEDDSCWGEKAQLALKSGFAGTNETMRRIQERLNLECRIIQQD